MSSAWSATLKAAAVVLSNNDRTATSSSGDHDCALATVSISTGEKVWIEINVDTQNDDPGVGIGNPSMPFGSRIASDDNSSGWLADGRFYVNNVIVDTYDTFTTGDVLNIAVDFAAGTAEYFKNGVSQGAPVSHGVTGDLFACCDVDAVGDSVTLVQPGAFTNSPPIGFTEYGTEGSLLTGTLSVSQEADSLVASGVSGELVPAEGSPAILGYMIFGLQPLGSPGGEETGGGGLLPRLVAILNGPAGYIKQVDANGLNWVDIRFNGSIVFPAFSVDGGPGDVLRYYKDPADKTGALLDEAVDPAWNMDLHRGNGFLNLGLFHINDPPMGEDAITGTLSSSQAGDSVSASAEAPISGTTDATQDDDIIIAAGNVGEFVNTGSLFASQADNLLFGDSMAIVEGTLAVTQASQVGLGQAESPSLPGFLEADVVVEGLIGGEVYLGGLIGGEVFIGPVMEGAVQ